MNKLETIKTKEQYQEEEYKLPYHWLVQGVQQLMYESRAKYVLDFLEPIKGERVLDLGCGDGLFLSNLVESKTKSYGIDISERAISFCKALVPKAKVQLCSSTKLPFKNNYFDAIVSLDVLEHLDNNDLVRTLREVRRVLKQGSLFVFSVPSSNMDLGKKHYQHFDNKKIHQIFKYYFNIEEVIGYVQKIPFHRFFWKRHNYPLISIFAKSSIRKCNPNKCAYMIVKLRKIY